MDGPGPYLALSPIHVALTQHLLNSHSVPSLTSQSLGRKVPYTTCPLSQSCQDVRDSAVEGGFRVGLRVLPGSP